MSVEIVKRLRNADRAVSDLLWEMAEFDLLEEDTLDWFKIEPERTVQVVGRDGSGGRFCLVPGSDDYSGRLLYVDSEGHAGIIADSLTAGLQMMIALPSWHGCLKFSGGGSLDAMRRAQARLEADLRKERPDYEHDRETLYRALGIARPTVPLEALHRAVSEGTDVRAVNPADGWPYEGLFNTFVVDDMLRRRS